MVLNISTFKAVIFDMGGVMLTYHDCDDFVRVAFKLKNYPELRPIMKGLDIGNISTEEMSRLVKEKVHDDDEVRAHFDRFTFEMTRKHMMPDKLFFDSLAPIQDAGLKTALLTNNFYMKEDRSLKVIVEEADEIFDVVVESCVEGCSKPDSKIYKITLERLGVKAKECVFVDDLKENCDAAEALGMTAVLVEKGKSNEAVEQIGSLIGVTLSSA
ncbi:hypothetical protein L596_014640 [Steinernema carpocapsae]|uniref:HAD family phosphatase n=1 Tax=Steinernema carpocapsae TaxID=34508 RepID=A0A4U5NCH4_STECR|nr:hypothetical protein L596_014640 [Steinernema carpocapsae]